VEAAIAAGRLAPSTRLPPVRELASTLEVSPATVAAAYKALNARGLVTANRRRGTVVAAPAPVRVRGARPLPPGARDLATGNPDTSLLPAVRDALDRVDTEPKLYGGPAKLDRLVALARDDFDADRVRGEIAVVGGALDGIERVLQTQLRAGDRVVVEDPSWPRIADLVSAVGLAPAPVAIDQQGLVPDELERALTAGARAVVSTPRGQNPTGAAIDEPRARALRSVLARHPDVLAVEDDFLGAVAGPEYVSIHDESPRWVVIRTLSKTLGPDLRVATMIGDPITVARVESRQLLGSGWVSHLLQQTAAELWRAAAKKLLPRARRTYAERRDALVAALAERGIGSYGKSGLGVWIPVAEEVPVVQELLDRGLAVSAGERFRFDSPPGIRVTTTTLEPHEAEDVADGVAAGVFGDAVTYAG
jgi:DNA-binding transcriptional MocR family regulator